MKTVHVVFKTHLDIGFTDLASRVIEKYMEQYIPKAIALAEQLAAEEGPAKFIWTTGSWLIAEYLRRADDAAREAMEQAIRCGHVAWHGLPFTTHTELLDADLFEYGLSIAGKLDARFGKTTIAAKMSDVPGHTRAILPHLARRGIEFLHLGVNNASKVPSVPALFVWRAPDGSSVIVNYTQSYGRVLEVDRLGEVLVFAHTGDNVGPPSAEKVKALFAELAEKYPGAEIRASTMDRFAERLQSIKHQLPIVEEEIGDTWIHGAGTDPWKIARYRELLRLRRRWLLEGAFAPDGEDLDGFSRGLLMIAEHTWGMDIKKYLPDFRHYTKQEFLEARKADVIPDDAVPDKYLNPKYRLPKEPRTYSRFESSWQEQREYLDQAIAALSPDKQEEVCRAFAALEPGISASTAKKTPEPLLVGKTYRLGSFDLAFAGDGSIARLTDGNGKAWADDNHRLGQFSYEAFGVEHYHNWFEQYVSNQYRTVIWAELDFGKPGIELCQPPLAGGRYLPALASLQLIREEGRDIVVADLRMPDDAFMQHGAPEELQAQYIFDKNGRIDYTLTWRNKKAHRLPEASWCTFSPLVDNPNLWKMNKLGEAISPLHVVRDGGRNLHAVGADVFYTGSEGSVAIETLDAPLLAPGKPRLLQFDNTFAPLDGGMHFNLHNNVWGTNFPLWCEDDLTFRFSIVLNSVCNSGKAHQ